MEGTVPWESLKESRGRGITSQPVRERGEETWFPECGRFVFTCQDACVEVLKTPKVRKARESFHNLQRGCDVRLSLYTLDAQKYPLAKIVRSLVLP